MKVLLIDDQRTAEYIKATKGIDVTRVASNFAEGIQALKEDKYDLLLLDHDLGSYDQEESRELTGTDIMYFLKEHPEYLPGKIQFVSANPVGVQRMTEIYASMMYRPG